ncbi:MAG: hypothetical protein HEQ16_08565 [Bosea sp.]|nr:hypothetical protein [Bosea sp. (in: a-proteobacteria)]
MNDALSVWLPMRCASGTVNENSAWLLLTQRHSPTLRFAPRRHCERSEAIQRCGSLHAVIASVAKQSSAAVRPDRQHCGAQRLDCFAALAMTAVYE